MRDSLHRIAANLALFGTVFFLVRLTLWTVIERLRPAYRISCREVVGRDIGAILVCAFLIIPLAMYVNRWVAFRPEFPKLGQLPLAARFVLYLLIADFGHYWIHRFMHSRHAWRIHKWHHAPEYMYWLAGARGSLFQTILVNVPYIFAEGLLRLSPWWMQAAILVKNSVQNDWMHINVRWGSRWLEWLVVTPRYHHIHHSDDPRHYKANLAALFPLWDHLFGTYVDPDETPEKLTFGIGERVSAVRLAVGI